MYFPNENSINLKVGIKDKIYVYPEVVPKKCVCCMSDIDCKITYKINGNSIAHRCGNCEAIYMEYYAWLYMNNRDSYNVFNLDFAEAIRDDILREQRISQKLSDIEKRIKRTRRKMEMIEERKQKEAIREEKENMRAIKARNGEPLGKLPKQKKRSLYS